MNTILNRKIVVEIQHKNRIDYLDVIKGLCILSVVFCHISSIKEINKWVGESVQVAAFFFVSGMLFKEDTVTNFIKKKGKRLLIPYFFFAVCSFIYWALLERRFRGADAYMTTLEGFKGIFVVYFPWLFFNGTLWFLVCLFVTSLIWLLLFKILKNKNRYLMPIALCLIAFLGSVIYKIELPFTLNRAAWYIIFYAFGYYFTKTKKTESDKNDKFIFVILLLFYIITNIDEWHLNDLNLYLILGGEVLFVVYSSKLIAPKDKVLKYLGEHSLIIMCMHGPVYRAVIGVLSMALDLSTDIIRNNFSWCLSITFISIVICLIGEAFLNKYLPLAIGKTKLRRPEAFLS